MEQRRAEEEESARKQVFGLVSSNQQLQDEISAEKRSLQVSQREYEVLLREKEQGDLTIEQLKQREDRNEQVHSAPP